MKERLIELLRTIDGNPALTCPRYSYDLIKDGIVEPAEEVKGGAE